MNQMNSILRLPDELSIETSTGTEKIKSEKVIHLHDITVKTEFILDELTVSLTAENTPVKYICFRWNMEIPNAAKILGDAWERGYGDLEWHNIEAQRVLPWYFLMKHDDEVSGFGVKVRPAALCYWQCDESGITLCMDVRCGGVGVILKNRVIDVATVVCGKWNESPFSAARKLCAKMCTDPILPNEPIYGSNNWYYAYGTSSHDEIMKDTKYLAGLTKGLKNRPYMVIDDGWQKNRANDYIGGPWNEGNCRFPDMKGLASEMKALDIKPGIWLRLLLDNDASIPSSWRSKRDCMCLDPSVPEVLSHVAEDIRRISDWGYQLIKHDFSTYDIFGKWGFEAVPDMAENGWSFYDTSKTSAEIVVQFYKTIIENAGDALILGCNCIGHLGAGLMHLNRTGDDTSGFDWERTRKMGVNTLAFRLPQNKTFYAVDADCVGITGEIPWKLNRQWLELLSKSGSPLFVSVKHGVLSQAEEEELSAAYAISSVQSDIAIPLDWTEALCPKEWLINDELAAFDWHE